MPLVAARAVVLCQPAQRAEGNLDRRQVLRTDGPTLLVLVTCGGPYDRHARSLAESVVVTAVPV